MKTREKKQNRSVKARVRRQDGVATRRLILETAGMVFAENGRSATTSKTICERAGTPMASVNYHFGSKEALYQEVLAEAQRQITTLDELMIKEQDLNDPKRRLCSVVAELIRLSTSDSGSWGFRVMLREVLSPSAGINARLAKSFRANAKILAGLMADVLDLPRDHPTVRRAVIFVFLPCVSMTILPSRIAGRPSAFTSKDAPDLIEAFVCYAMAGLDALAHGRRPR